MEPNITPYKIGGYLEYKSDNLGPMIDSVWLHSTAPNAPRGGFHQLVPEPTANIALSRKRNTNGIISEQHAILCGPVNKARKYELDPGHELIAIRIKPEWVEPLFDIAAEDITDDVIGLKLASPDLNDRLCRLFDGEMKTFEILNQMNIIFKRFADQKRDKIRFPEYALMALDIMRKFDGTVNQGKLNEYLNVSERQLRRAIKNMIGLSPKEFSRLVRFLTTLKFADMTEKIEWADCAACFGYFDQAHLINEFKIITTYTPTELMKSRQNESVFSNPF